MNTALTSVPRTSDTGCVISAHKSRDASAWDEILNPTLSN